MMTQVQETGNEKVACNYLVNFQFQTGNPRKLQIIITVSRNKKCVSCFSVTFIRTNAPVTLALQKEQNNLLQFCTKKRPLQEDNWSGPSGLDHSLQTESDLQ